jgi:hypothetical protein
MSAEEDHTQRRVKPKREDSIKPQDIAVNGYHISRVEFDMLIEKSTLFANMGGEEEGEDDIVVTIQDNDEFFKLFLGMLSCNMTDPREVVNARSIYPPRRAVLQLVRENMTPLYKFFEWLSYVDCACLLELIRDFIVHLWISRPETLRTLSQFSHLGELEEEAVQRGLRSLVEGDGFVAYEDFDNDRKYLTGVNKGQPYLIHTSSWINLRIRLFGYKIIKWFGFTYVNIDAASPRYVLLPPRTELEKRMRVAKKEFITEFVMNNSRDPDGVFLRYNTGYEYRGTIAFDELYGLYRSGYGRLIHPYGYALIGGDTPAVFVNDLVVTDADRRVDFAENCDCREEPLEFPMGMNTFSRQQESCPHCAGDIVRMKSDALEHMGNVLSLGLTMDHVYGDFNRIHDMLCNARKTFATYRFNNSKSEADHLLGYVCNYEDYCTFLEPSLARVATMNQTEDLMMNHIRGMLNVE